MALSGACIRKLKNNKNSYIITGTFLKDCSGSPLANTELILQLESNEFLGMEWGGSTNYFRTDSEGNFSVSYQAASNSNISIVSKNNISINRLYSAIPQNTNINIGKVYLSRRFNTIVNITVNDLSNYNENDTLYYTVNGKTPLRISVYPFLTPISDTINSILILNSNVHNRTHSFEAVWSFNPKILKNRKSKTINKICSGYNEITIEI